MNKFFFDVADVKYIEDKWNKISSKCNSENVIGVTTNPGIWVKFGITNMIDMKKRLRELSSLITAIRGDDKGIVYTQPLNSNWGISEIAHFIEEVQNESDGKTKIGCKIPPFMRVLKQVDNLKNKYNIDFNVTGISDCATAIMASTYNVRYISVIPGRMEEKEIDAKTQINYIRHANLGETEIITGSMRTVDGLRWVCQCGTVPTIGTRVWDAIIEEVGGDNFCSLWEPYQEINELQFAPNVTDEMTGLSIGFFNQMNELGKSFGAE